MQAHGRRPEGARTSRALERLDLSPPGPDDVVVDVEWSGISTGTERLLWSGRMPPFPGMGYPLVPGYELVGRVTQAGDPARSRSAARLRSRRALLRRGARPVRRRSLAPRRAGQRASCRSTSSSASTASCWRWPRPPTTRSPRPARCRPSCIVGHGVLGRLLARLRVATGGEPPIVWERNPNACGGAIGYQVLDPGRGSAPRLRAHLRRERRCRRCSTR